MSKLELFFKKKEIIFCILISFLIVTIWFSSGEQLASGEESFSIFNKVSMDLQTSWWQPSGSGYPIPIYINRLVPIIFTKTLLSLNIQMFLIQAVFYFILIFTGMVGMYFFVRELLKENSFVPLIASIFYFLNLYSQLQIFGRFLYSGMMAWSFLPISLFFWMRWSETFKFKWMVYFSLTSVLFSLSYLQPANIITLWTPLAIWSFYLLFKNRKNLSLVSRIILISTLGIVMWALINVWWLYPYIKIGNLSFISVVSFKSNIDSLVGVSKYFNTPQVLLLRQNFFLGSTSQFYSFYSQVWVYLVSIMVLVIAFIGFIKGRKSKYWLYLVILLFIGWFISKGSNPPFGKAFFGWLFSTIPSSAVLRNPYEKFGIVWLLPYSVFFALGLAKIKNKLLRIFILFLACGVLVWPIWTGRIMKNKRVSVPDYYQEANSWLNQQASDARLFHVPATLGDGMAYSWNYNGVEPSEFLFDKASVSKIVRTKYFDSKYQSLLVFFNENKDFQRIFREMNIGYVILHKDIDSGVSWGDYKKPEAVLKSARNIMLVASFGDLDIYKFDGLDQNSLFETSEGSQVTTYTKINPRHYKVFIKGATKPFSLNFKTTFNESWKARINNLELKEHTLVYDYANDWRIDKEGDYTIDIVFKVWPWE